MRGRRRCSAIEIGGPFDRGRGGPGGWWILDEPELHFGEDVLVPDLAGWRRERMPAFPTSAWVELAPDWVCEVLSPGTRRLDLTDKRDIYGVGRASGISGWSIRWRGRSRPSRYGTGPGCSSRRCADDAEVRVPPFEAVGFPLSALWTE